MDFQEEDVLLEYSIEVIDFLMGRLQNPVSLMTLS